MAARENVFRGVFLFSYQIRKDGISNPLRQLQQNRPWVSEISIYQFLEKAFISQI
jgi:hypothetical protein